MLNLTVIACQGQLYSIVKSVSDEKQNVLKHGRQARDQEAA
jgi:hypothetical protein